MAFELKPGDYFTFDQQDSNRDAVMHEERGPGLGARVRSFLSSRYALLSMAFLLAGCLIFYNTAALQLNPSAASGISETSGVSRQQTIQAPRGDIYDSSGVPLAYSETVQALYLTYAKLEIDDLNAMLLDLSLYLESRHVVITSELTDYFTLSPAEGDDTDSGRPVFMKEKDEIVYWQANDNLFNLKEHDDPEHAVFDDKYVKQDPAVFYDYLLYDKFDIEDPKADGLRYSREDAFRIMKLRYLILENNWAFLNGTPIELASPVGHDVISVINEQNYRFKGVITGQKSERVYADDASYLSHVIGYTGQISASDYDELKSLGYSADAVVGQSGVEYSAERYLSGQNGVKPYNIWSNDGADGIFFSEAIGKEAVAGYNVRLTIDLNLQKVAQNALASVITEIRNSASNKNRGDADAGAVVMLDVKTGEVLAMASYPYYDPNDFVLMDTDEEAAARVKTYLTDNEQKPMWNRAIMEIYAPGSTFKPATAVAGLESGTITPTSSTIRCVGTEEIGEWVWHCLEFPSRGHGDLTLIEALATSCNMYFYNLGYRTGIDQIDYWGQKLGLGELTGIDLPGEAKGYRSSRTTKKLLRSEASDQIWFPADTCQSAIGQFDNSFSIIQLATYATALATGNKVTPHVIKEITRTDGVVIKDNADLVPVPIGLQESTLETVRAGMIAVAADPEGTAYSAFGDFPIPVAAKTGTAETGKEDISSSNGLFICYAPADDPQVAIAQIVEKGAWGSSTTGIAKALLTAYFGLDAESTGVADLITAPGLQYWPSATDPDLTAAAGLSD